MSKFKEGVIKIVRTIPSGRVASYGQVALYLGMPRAGRQVGWILNKLGSDTPVPWWRIVNNKGYLSIKGSEFSAEDQKNLLVSEGLEISKDFTFDIDRYRFVPDEKFIQILELDPFYLDSIAGKIPYSSRYHK